MAEQRARLVHAPLADEAPDARAAHHEVLVADGVDLLGLETVAPAEHPQHRKVARAVPAEQKVRAYPDFGDVQPVHEHGADEHFRIPPREIRREADDRGAVHAGVGDRLELLLLGHQQRRRLVGPHDPRRVRVEGHDDGGRAALAGDPPHAIENLAVAAVHTVEVAEREDRLRPSHGARVVGEMDDVHDYVNGRARMVRQAHHERDQAHHERDQAHHERDQAHHERDQAHHGRSS